MDRINQASLARRAVGFATDDELRALANNSVAMLNPQLAPVIQEEVTLRAAGANPVRPALRAADPLGSIDPQGEVLFGGGGHDILLGSGGEDSLLFEPGMSPAGPSGAYGQDFGGERSWPDGGLQPRLAALATNGEAAAADQLRTMGHVRLDPGDSSINDALLGGAGPDFASVSDQARNGAVASRFGFRNLSSDDSSAVNTGPPSTAPASGPDGGVAGGTGAGSAVVETEEDEEDEDRAWADALIRGGLSTLAAASGPGASGLGAIAQGGAAALAELDAAERREREREREAQEEAHQRYILRVLAELAAQRERPLPSAADDTDPELVERPPATSDTALDPRDLYRVRDEIDAGFDPGVPRTAMPRIGAFQDIAARDLGPVEARLRPARLPRPSVRRS